ncbi:MAG: formylglycine-generating enzyme family protein, partial [Pirellulales bacterium]
MLSRSARRIAIQPSYRNPNIGFRVVIDCEISSSPDVADKPSSKPRAGDTITNALGMKLALIPPGSFRMGSDENPDELEKAFEISDSDEALMEGLAGFPEFFRPKSYAAEHPVHRVQITKPFYMGVYEVTKRQFRRFVAAAAYKTDAEKDGKGGWLWVQEAEWEYACRAGTDTRFYNGDDQTSPINIGNVRGFRLDVVSHTKPQPGITHTHLTPRPKDGYVLTAPVGQFRRNRFGLYDMTGNVSEWCADWFEAEYYAKAPLEDPQGSAGGAARVIRGGGCSLSLVGAHWRR